MSTGLTGEAGLWISVVFGLVAMVAGRRRWLVAAALAASAATALLTWALLAPDFSLGYVAETTSLATPWPYRVAALWGGMDGSMLFYSTVTLLIAASALRGRRQVRIGAVVGVGLILVTIFFANPFSMPDLPAVDGAGLLAILQHPAMIYHPPILYLGLIVLLVPFALSADADATNRSERLRHWMYLSWTLLTFGMAFGSNWAYVELGWGGIWAWDPVENTALLPWLAATVWLHTSRLEASTGGLRRTNLLMTGLPFALSVVGVYLTRSGVTGSIHSFAEDRMVGRILLAAAAFVVVWLGVVTMRSPRGRQIAGLSALDRWLVLQACLFSAVLIFVAAGTLYPAITSVFTQSTVTVDSRFYVVTLLPLGILIAGAISLSHRVGPMAYGLVAAVMFAVVAALVRVRAGLPLVATAGASALLLIPLLTRRSRISVMAHLGMAVLLVGVGGSALGADFNGAMRVGESVSVGGHNVTLVTLETGEADRYVFVKASFDVDGAVLEPEIRGYEDQAVPVAEPALDAGLVDDVTVAISLLFPDAETVAVSVFVRPLLWLVWMGAGLMGLAGVLALFGRGGVGATRHRSATAEQPPGGTTIDSASR